MAKPKQPAATPAAAATSRTPRAAAAAATLHIATMKPSSSSSPSRAAPTAAGGHHNNTSQLPMAAQSDPELCALLHRLQNRAETALRRRIKQVDADVDATVQDCARVALAIVADVDQQRAELDTRHRQIWDDLGARVTDAHAQLALLVAEFQDAVERICAEYAALTDELRIFERFEQADESIARTHGGTGLGLSICQSLCVLMHTQLHVESTLGAGSHFFFEAEFATASSMDVARSDLVLAPAHLLPPETLRIGLLRCNHVGPMGGEEREFLDHVLRPQLNSYGTVTQYSTAMAPDLTCADPAVDVLISQRDTWPQFDHPAAMKHMLAVQVPFLLVCSSTADMPPSPCPATVMLITRPYKQGHLMRAMFSIVRAARARRAAGQPDMEIKFDPETWIVKTGDGVNLIDELPMPAKITYPDKRYDMKMDSNVKLGNLDQVGRLLRELSSPEGISNDIGNIEIHTKMGVTVFGMHLYGPDSIAAVKKYDLRGLSFAKIFDNMIDPKKTLPGYLGQPASKDPTLEKYPRPKPRETGPIVVKSIAMTTTDKGFTVTADIDYDSALPFQVNLPDRAETALRRRIKQVDADVDATVQDCARVALAIVADVDQQRAELDTRHRQIWDDLGARVTDAHAQLALLVAEFQDAVERICAEYAALTDELVQLDADYLAAARLPPTEPTGTAVSALQFAAPVAPPTPYTACRSTTAAMWGMSSLEVTPMRPAAGLFTARMAVDSPRSVAPPPPPRSFGWPLGPGMEVFANRRVSGGMDGFEATRRIIDFFAHMPPARPDPPPIILGLSADAMEEQEMHGMQCGMTAYLRKPLLKKDIMSILAKFGAASPHT
ncbi:hypothetical protein AMAG_12742 [Allomyces macrogynus ATCC 38327]|uniref:histidine kinase n=1 Tax=Allomyces macrogynus (strain ATCC 38327) TaxID=578462 RepID=A0A0L0T1G4_ALLM3|nr:hypothetical protein AMAG_12742 [Allomyces macrogynus ATCC 38327]|eukprot:KNE68572.1 hypothetical protein AMAG_12742 [Allomyces macrogynus ATCC 38327]